MQCDFSAENSKPEIPKNPNIRTCGGFCEFLVRNIWSDREVAEEWPGTFRQKFRSEECVTETAEKPKNRNGREVAGLVRRKFETGNSGKSKKQSFLDFLEFLVWIVWSPNQK